MAITLDIELPLSSDRVIVFLMLKKTLNHVSIRLCATIGMNTVYVIIAHQLLMNIKTSVTVSFIDIYCSRNSFLHGKMIEILFLCLKLFKKCLEISMINLVIFRF